ncbi:hypothetical protein ORN01_24980 [Bacillus cereus]|uniref:hypothetical protein n=1 Tax=Bacillus cereus group TaxID=86661 RepID=UPI0022E962B2|nr:MULTISPECIES: hypothetical protein [Bacillus cereus group]MDA1509577.1 hypothetical protein [Bacillus cereus group sp. TH36-2LC]MDZ4632212.1 hypothetical protein [Bacillus cereus]
MELLEVQSFIDDNIFYREKWDALPDEKIKQVVINNAEILLKRELPHHFNDKMPVPVDVMVEQCLHILERDDSHRRAEMGVSYFMASGLYLSFDKNFKDWTIAPAILKAYPRRKSGRYVYSRPDTFRRY